MDGCNKIASPFAAPGVGLDAGTFQALDVAAKMAFLNIEAKLRETSIDGAPLMSFVRAVRHVAVDRVFLLFDAALKARMPRSGDFAAAPGHGAPKGVPDLPGHPDSWKHTRFAEGNVQLSFSRDAVPFPAGGPSSLVHSADVDIDLGRGLAHAKEWLENNVFRPGHKTSQALVYALLYAQGILPRYIARSGCRDASRGPAAQTDARLAEAPEHAATIVAPAIGGSTEESDTLDILQRQCPRDTLQSTTDPDTRLARKGGGPPDEAGVNAASRCPRDAGPTRVTLSSACRHHHA